MVPVHALSIAMILTWLRKAISALLQLRRRPFDFAQRLPRVQTAAGESRLVLRQFLELSLP